LSKLSLSVLVLLLLEFKSYSVSAFLVNDRSVSSRSVLQVNVSTVNQPASLNNTYVIVFRYCWTAGQIWVYY